jgi:CHAD domain-containing protein
MSFVLEAGEPLGPGLRRILTEETLGAAEGLERASESTWVEAVHEARKSVKKSRAVVRLVRSTLGPLSGDVNAHLRDIGRALSEVRDANVLVATADKLAEAGHDSVTRELFGPVHRILSDRSERATRKAMGDGLHERTSMELRRVAALLDRASWDWAEWEPVGDGLRREYRRGRSAFEAARRDPDGAATHDWRKRVKDHWYHLRLFRAGWPPVLKQTAKAAHALSDLLGDEHDLAVLREELRVEEGELWDPARSESIMALADRRRGELFAEAVPLGRRLYAEKPPRFAARIHGYWNAARSEEHRSRAHAEERAPA